MTQDSEIEKRMLELDELHARLAQIGRQPATARVQRLAGPGGALSFAGLALVWNEPGSRRAILRLRTERDGLSQALKAHGT